MLDLFKKPFFQLGLVLIGMVFFTAQSEAGRFYDDEQVTTCENALSIGVGKFNSYVSIHDFESRFRFRSGELNKYLSAQEKRQIFDFVTSRKMLLGLFGESLLKMEVNGGRQAETLSLHYQLNLIAELDKKHGAVWEAWEKLDSDDEWINQKYERRVTQMSDVSALAVDRLAENIIKILEAAFTGINDLDLKNLDEITVLNQRELDKKLTFKVQHRSSLVEVSMPQFPYKLNSSLTVPEFLSWVREDSNRLEFLKWVIGVSIERTAGIQKDFESYLFAQYQEWPNEDTIWGRTLAWTLRKDPTYEKYRWVRNAKIAIGRAAGIFPQHGKVSLPQSGRSYPGLRITAQDLPKKEITSLKIDGVFVPQADLLQIELAALIISNVNAVDFFTAIEPRDFIKFKNKTLQASGLALETFVAFKKRIQKLDTELEALKARINTQHRDSLDLRFEAQNLTQAEDVHVQAAADLEAVKAQWLRVVHQLEAVRVAGLGHFSAHERIAYEGNLLSVTASVKKLQVEIEALMPKIFSDMQSSRSLILKKQAE